MKEKIKKIIWISGGCDYGKTAFVDSIIKEFKNKNKKTYKLDGKDFIGFLVKNIRNKNPIENFVSRFQNHDLLVLDDIDYGLLSKPATQRAVKEVIQRITDNNKTKIILITQKRARKMRKLKFDSNCCEYIRLKAPSTDFKIKLVKEWLEKEKLAIPQDKIEEIVNKSNNLFQLKGLLNQISFPTKYSE
ncbi:MAG: DnaA/Hda family protein [Candidatus Nealsonbacteria bacterium]|nr:DnaA/Hda family protein [Candidatus Nealsonbacteria bacterium]